MECFFTKGGPRNVKFWSEVQETRTYCGQSLFLCSGWSEIIPQRMARGYLSNEVNGCQG